MRSKKFTFEQAVVNLMKYSRNTFYTWKREKRPIIALLEKYFTKYELKEFLETGEIKKLELIKDKSVDELERLFKEEHNKAILDEIESLKQKQAELESRLV